MTGSLLGFCDMGTSRAILAGHCLRKWTCVFATITPAGSIVARSFWHHFMSPSNNYLSRDPVTSSYNQGTWGTEEYHVIMSYSRSHTAKALGLVPCCLHSVEWPPCLATLQVISNGSRCGSRPCLVLEHRQGEMHSQLRTGQRPLLPPRSLVCDGGHGSPSRWMREGGSDLFLSSRWCRTQMGDQEQVAWWLRGSRQKEWPGSILKAREVLAPPRGRTEVMAAS
jgi:hypothetical protein